MKKIKEVEEKVQMVKENVIVLRERCGKEQGNREEGKVRRRRLASAMEIVEEGVRARIEREVEEQLRRAMGNIQSPIIERRT